MLIPELLSIVLHMMVATLLLLIVLVMLCLLQRVATHQQTACIRQATARDPSMLSIHM
jgi:hypothetical protein